MTIDECNTLCERFGCPVEGTAIYYRGRIVAIIYVKEYVYCSVLGDKMRNGKICEYSESDITNNLNDLERLLNERIEYLNYERKQRRHKYIEEL